MLILPTQGKDFLRRCCTYFGIGGALILELTHIASETTVIIFFQTHRRSLMIRPVVRRPIRTSDPSFLLVFNDFYEVLS